MTVNLDYMQDQEALAAAVAAIEQPPAQPEGTPAQPEGVPAQPGQPPAQPEGAPTQPGQPPTQPGQPPTQPGQPPAQPGQPPAQPGQPPAQPQSVTELWKRITDLDRENRTLKQQHKTAGNIDDFKKLAKENPTQALEKLGLTFDDIFDSWSNEIKQPTTEQSQQTPTTDKQLLKELEAIKAKLAGYEQAEEKRAQQNFYQQEVRSYEQAAGKDENRWKLVNLSKEDGSMQLAFQVAAHMYKMNGGQVPAPEDVLDALEEHLEKQAEKQSTWLSTKRGMKQATQPPAAPAQKQQQQQATKQSAPTLAGSEGEDTTAPEELTDEQRMKLAIQEIESRLKDRAKEAQ